MNKKRKEKVKKSEGKKEYKKKKVENSPLGERGGPAP